MRVTDKQAYVLRNLHRVKLTSGPSRIMYMLDGESCHQQVIGLAARGIIAFKEWGSPSKIADPTGIIRTSWKGSVSSPVKVTQAEKT